MSFGTVSLRVLTPPTAAVLIVAELADAGYPLLGVALGFAGLGVWAYVQ